MEPADPRQRLELSEPVYALDLHVPGHGAMRDGKARRLHVPAKPLGSKMLNPNAEGWVNEPVGASRSGRGGGGRTVGRNRLQRRMNARSNRGELHFPQGLR